MLPPSTPPPTTSSMRPTLSTSSCVVSVVSISQSPRSRKLWRRGSATLSGCLKKSRSWRRRWVWTRRTRRRWIARGTPQRRGARTTPVSRSCSTKSKASGKILTAAGSLSSIGPPRSPSGWTSASTPATSLRSRSMGRSSRTLCAIASTWVHSVPFPLLPFQPRLLTFNSSR